MKVAKSRIFLALLALGFSGLLNPWVALSMALLLLSLLVALTIRNRRVNRMGQGALEREFSDLAYALRQLKEHHFEGEVFGLNAHFRDQVVFNARQIDLRERMRFEILIRNRFIVELFLGVQTVLTVVIVGLTDVRFDPWATCFLLLLPFITYAVVKSHVIDDGLEAERAR